jgi:hypothetical protein
MLLWKWWQVGDGVSVGVEGKIDKDSKFTF